MLLISGLANGILALVLLLVPYFRDAGFAWLLAMTVGTVGVAAAAWVDIARNPGRQMGIRLAVVSIYLGLTPAIAMFWKLLR